MNNKSKIDIVVADATGSLYAKEPKVYPREVDGRFQRLRTAAVFWLLGMFYAFPWISIGGQQLVLFDLPERRFHVFGLTFWPQDFYLLTLLLIIAALSLFFFTALAGRLWCGYACPQTVWTEVFLWMERKIEGDRNARMRLDKAPWTAEKLLRKSAKQFVWIVFALWTGFTFVGFFTPIRELGHEALNGGLGGWESFWIVFYGFATYGNAGFLREQVCKYMCPYARFQSAMFDRDTLVISYDPLRGEPRGHRRRAAERFVPAGESVVAFNPLDATVPDGQQRVLGDCIDCLACVQVCPTGIDIREGLQIECIACAACIDACDAVMDKMEYPRGLIRYTTENSLVGKPQRVLRPRTLIYAGILASVIGAFLWLVSARDAVIIEVLHDRNALFRTIGQGAIENSYNVKLVNKTDADMLLSLRTETDLPLRMIGRPSVTLAPNEVYSLPLTLRAESGTVHGRQPISVTVVDAQGNVLVRGDSHFFAPESP
ncbi:cytochrome c oxidase accessory protein CcoG [Dokdonella immobilis]|uniref:Cytochrome c oxidase accessory protein FixG n=1 Tax=Dokdonella immobilis TaxID=578942 RepID=A0A1I5ADD4_9GAMM|nr:cytochrome c oxidase accessory protein CcoG [Dokdonella immobilis]SFN60427.1 cytochrome c oxidase accessory protein FixG [Dokdonella immobilis]